MINDEIALDWIETSNALEVLKEKEKTLRLTLLTQGFNFSENAFREGTETYVLGAGYKLKAGFKMNRLLIGSAEELSQAARDIGNDKLFRWKAELSLSEYRKLANDELAVVDRFIEAKPGLPSLTLMRPK